MVTSMTPTVGGGGAGGASFLQPGANAQSKHTKCDATNRRQPGPFDLLCAFALIEEVGDLNGRTGIVGPRGHEGEWRQCAS